MVIRQYNVNPVLDSSSWTILNVTVLKHFFSLTYFFISVWQTDGLTWLAAFDDNHTNCVWSTRFAFDSWIRTRDGPSLTGFQIGNLRYHHFYLTNLSLSEECKCSQRHLSFTTHWVILVREITRDWGSRVLLLTGLYYKWEDQSILEALTQSQIDIETLLLSWPQPESKFLEAVGNLLRQTFTSHPYWPPFPSISLLLRMFDKAIAPFASY